MRKGDPNKVIKKIRQLVHEGKLKEEELRKFRDKLDDLIKRKNLKGK